MSDEAETKDDDKAEGRSKEPRLDPAAPVEAGRPSSDKMRTSVDRTRASAGERARTSLERSRAAAAQGSAENTSTSSENLALPDVDASTRSDSPPTSSAADSHATSEPMAIPTATPNARRTPSPGSGGVTAANGHEGPITPRNDAGPWVFDGSGARIGVAPTATAPVTRQSLNGVVDAMETDT